MRLADLSGISLSPRRLELSPSSEPRPARHLGTKKAPASGRYSLSALQLLYAAVHPLVPDVHTFVRALIALVAIWRPHRCRRTRSCEKARLHNKRDCKPPTG